MISKVLMAWFIVIFLCALTGWIVYKLFKLGVLDKIIASFDNTTNGFSARKLSAFVGIIVALVATFRFVDEKVIIQALMVWLTFALMCLGIITAEQVLKFYKKGDDGAPVQPDAPSSPVVQNETNVTVNVPDQK